MNSRYTLDKDKAVKSLDKLFEIFKDISSNADEVFKNRCPYKNAKSRCTAKFECKNQHNIKKFGESPVCTGSDRLDYRPAWISNKRLTS
tara:strand:+ start:513 stop:779 length:267 start_codon:yes stop_codon:yes gene_type:complete